jgi:glyoxylase-like metal-dependent hydrolase (beta-lactamase superfamily II)
MALERLTERVQIWRGGVNFALIEGDEKRLILIDSGLDSSNARKALRPYLEQGYTLYAILNTHSHADHIGGNADLVRRTGCQVYAPAIEAAFVRFPELEPIGLYGGVVPPDELHTKFLRAEPTPVVNELPAAPGHVRLANVAFELIPTPGHSLGQVAVAVDGVLIAADALFMPEVIDRHPILFLVDVAAYLESLERIGARHERLILPGHGALIDRREEEDPLPAILEANRTSVRLLQEQILGALSDGPQSLETVLARVWASLGKEQKGEAQYHLDRASIAAHLTDLGRREMVSISFCEGRRLITNR